MALTQDQSEMLQTAVNNLNASVEVNKEVLEIVKSVGNTGAVDISLHNNDAAAHVNGFNNLFALASLYVGSKTFYNGEPAAARLSASNSGEYGSSELNFFSRVNPTAQTNKSRISFNYDVDTNDANTALSLGGIRSAIHKGEQSIISHVLSFSRNCSRNFSWFFCIYASAVSRMNVSGS